MAEKKLSNFFERAAVATNEVIREAELELRRANAAQRNFRAIEGWFSNLNWDGRPVGQEFLQAVQAAQCDVDLRKDAACPLYVPFDHALPEDKLSFINLLKYPLSTAYEPDSLFISTCHEFLHGLQWNAAPVLHASPYNKKADVVLGPLDFVMMTILTEQDAYAKQGWLNYIATGAHPDIRSSSVLQPVSADEFSALLQSHGDISKTLCEAALFAMRKDYTKNISGFTFADHYHRQALLQYKNIIEIKKESGLALPVFARLEDEDIVAIGSGFGPNLFTDGKNYPEFYRRPVLSDDNAKILKEIYEILGIENEYSLPYLGEALARAGLTRREFLEKSSGAAIKPNAPEPAPG